MLLRCLSETEIHQSVRSLLLPPDNICISRTFAGQPHKPWPNLGGGVLRVQERQGLATFPGEHALELSGLTAAYTFAFSPRCSDRAPRHMLSSYSLNSHCEEITLQPEGYMYHSIYLHWNVSSRVKQSK